MVRHEEACAGLLAWLRLEPMSEAQLLHQVLLPNFDALPREAVLNRVLAAGVWRHDAALRTALKGISFVRTGLPSTGGPLQTACIAETSFTAPETTLSPWLKVAFDCCNVC